MRDIDWYDLGERIFLTAMLVVAVCIALLMAALTISVWRAL